MGYFENPAEGVGYGTCKGKQESMGSVNNLAFPDRREMVSGLYVPLSFPALKVAMMSGAVDSMCDHGTQAPGMARVTTGIQPHVTELLMTQDHNPCMAEPLLLRFCS